jgi:hypothetical protein
MIFMAFLDTVRGLSCTFSASVADQPEAATLKRHDGIAESG